jgi:hypothetical protein
VKKEAERVEFRKWEDEVVVLCKANMKVQREVKVKAKKEAAVRSESEKVEGLKKHGQEDREGEISVTIDMTAVPIWSEQPHYKHHSIRLKCEERVTCLLQWKGRRMSV